MALKIININGLKEGMYVSKVVKQTGKIKVVTHGWVRSKEIIKTLKKRGVEKLEIDDGKTEHQPPNQAPEPIPEKSEQSGTETPSTLAAGLGSAAELLASAKKVQHKIFTQLKNGEKPSLEEVTEIAGGIIDSVKYNQDALVLLSCLRDKSKLLLEHCLNTAIYTCIIAKFLDFETSVVKQLTMGAMLHDVGKMHIHENILNKPGKLTQTEFKQVASSIPRGYKMLTNTIGMQSYVCEMVLNHKEHLDGSGYPRGLVGDDIDQYARILAVADAYDALVHDRPYAPAMAPATAFKILSVEQNCFDQKIVQALVCALGQYPVGSLVKLSNNHLAVVKTVTQAEPTKPLVTEFYNCNTKYFLPLKDINLAEKRNSVTLTVAVDAIDYGIDVSKFFNDMLIEKFSQ